MTSDELTAFAQRYAKAWCSQDPERVAAFFADDGSLTVNDGAPAVGRVAIAEIARGFMRAFPDMVVTMDDVSQDSDTTKFHWTLSGTNTGPGGTGNRVRISGYEVWKIDDGFIAESKRSFRQPGVRTPAQAWRTFLSATVDAAARRLESRTAAKDLSNRAFSGAEQHQDRRDNPARNHEDEARVKRAAALAQIAYNLRANKAANARGAIDEPDRGGGR